MKNSNNKKQTFLHEIINNILQLRILVIVLVIFVIISIYSPTFRKPSFFLENILRPASIISLISLGMTIILTSRGLDLSVGSNAAVSGTIGVLAFTDHNIPIWLGITIGLTVGMLFGLFNALFITKLKIAPFVVTLATMTLGRGVNLLIHGNLFTYGLADSFRNLGQGSTFGLPNPFLLVLIFWAITWYLFNKTKFGKYARAIGSNESAAHVAGIDVDRYKIYFYAYIGFLSALGGLLLSSRANMVAVTTGLGYELDAIAAVILGGTSMAGGAGTLTGSVLAAIMLVILDNGLQLLGISTFIQRAVVGLIIIIGLAYAAWQDEKAKKAARLLMAEKYQR